MASGNSTGAIALQLFSLDSKNPIYEYYQEGIALSKTDGVNKMYGDSIVRIDSISKLTTVYLLLIGAGDQSFSLPILDVVPELKGLDM